MIRRQSTKEILATSLQELAASKPVNEITVADIVRNCETTTTTFYNHFRDKYALVAWIYDTEVEKATMRLGNGASWLETVREYMQIMEDNRAFYLNALHNTSGADDFHLLSRTTDITYIINRIAQLNGVDKLDEESEFFIEFYIFAVSESIIRWFLGQSPLDADVVAHRCIQGVPQCIARLFDIPAHAGTAYAQS